MSASWNMKPGAAREDWELPPAGNLPAVCVGLIDLGTQQDAYLGKPREVHQLVIVWELTGMNSSKTGKPHVVCQKFTASLGRKATLRRTLESWRGMPIRDDEEFDLYKIVGAPCLLQISHDVTSSGSEIYSIDAATAIPRGMARPVPTYPLVRYRITDGANGALHNAVLTHEWLPLCYGKKIGDLIQGCVEFRGKPAAGEAHGQQQAPVHEPEPQDSVPF